MTTLIYTWYCGFEYAKIPLLGKYKATSPRAALTGAHALAEKKMISSC
jgi:hypothetical protein